MSECSTSTSSQRVEDILTPSEVTQLAAFYSTITLTGDQKERIARKFIEASGVERGLIARIYCTLFSDPLFLQRLMEKLKHYGEGSKPTSAMLLDEEDDDDNIGFDDSSYSAATTKSKKSAASGGSRKKKTSGSTPGSPLPQQREMRLANVVEEVTPRLIGDGPFTLEFGLVTNEEMRNAVVDIYSKQFVQPDAKTLAKMVTIPRSQSTRTRKNIKGSYTWFLKCLSTNEVVSCVTALVHRRDAHTSIVEVPLFATGSGYKKNGFAKLLNVALLEFCVDHMEECPLVVVSADPKAVPFWSHLGFRQMTRPEKKSIEFLYEHHFFKFQDSVPMTISLAELKERREEQRYEQWRTRTVAGPESMSKNVIEVKDESCEASSDGTNGSECESSAATTFTNDADHLGSVVLETLSQMPRFLLSKSPKLPYLV